MASHSETIEKLSIILTFIEKIENVQERNFLKLCFSAILTATTARRGKQHGWFADNTPLGKGMAGPPFIDAYALFFAKVERNLRVLECIYSHFERRGEMPEEVLAKFSVLRANATSASNETYGIERDSIGGIITSPPYLCMSDYSLGQRLSYAWLFPSYMERDFKEEIGARRRRMNPIKALNEYSEALNKFSEFSRNVVRPGGFVALVIGSPESSKFKDQNILGLIDSMMLRNGFSLFWEKWRPISWHRNHGYERLKAEKLTVFLRQ